MYYIVGGGIAGLIWAFYNPEYKIITPEIGGQMKTKFELGPRYLHKTQESKRLLQDLEMPIKTITIKVGYYFNGMLTGKPMPLFRELYYKKSRNRRDLKGFDASTMTGNKKRFLAYEVDFNHLIANLYAAIGSERFIKGKVISINTDKRQIVIANNHKAGRKTGKKPYHKIVWTAPLKFFHLIMHSQEEADAIELQDMTYTLLSRSPINFGNFYNYVYVVDERFDFHRITKTKQGYVVDMCGTKPYVSKNAVVHMTLKNAQLCNNIPAPRITRIKFVGRYATNNHHIKTEDIIKQAQVTK